MAGDEVTAFENDPDAVGMWEFVGLVPSREQFTPGHIKHGDYANVWQKTLCFLPNGGGYWIFKGWTRGKLYTVSGASRNVYANEYSIEKHGDETYLFLERWTHQLKCRGGQLQIHVYRKLDGREYAAEDMKIRDKVDLPFVMDENILGSWKAYDCIDDRASYSPDKRRFPEEALFCKSFEFFADGTVNETRTNGIYHIEWTKGTLLDHNRQTASAYEICEIDGREYLFVEWKSGDYLYGGMMRWYVYYRA